MRTCLKSASTVLLLALLTASCAAPYKSLQPVTADAKTSALRFKPQIDKKLYRCTVDGKFLFKKFHLSGILLIKQMPDASTRVVFQNEMGFSFFDFEWSAADSFKVNQVIPQLDKPGVITILQKDFELLMMKKLRPGTERQYRQTAAEEDTRDNNYYHRFDLAKGYAWYVLRENTSLKRIENAGERTRVTTISFNDTHLPAHLPDSLFIRHYKAHFTIALKKIEEHASE